MFYHSINNHYSNIFDHTYLTTPNFQLTHVLSDLDATLLETATCGPLADLFCLVDTASVTLELADLTGETMPGHSM